MSESALTSDLELQRYLREQFADLASAKAFARRWAIDLEQELPGIGMLSARAMAAHISDVLEGHAPRPGLVTDYMATRYGSEIFHAMWAPA